MNEPLAQPDRARTRSIRLTNAELERVTAAAVAAGKSTHAFMRDAVLDAAVARDLSAQMRGVEAAIRAARRAGILCAKP